MLNFWAELLPLFIVRWLALRKCEQIPALNCNVAIAREDVLVVVPKRRKKLYTGRARLDL